MSNSTEDNFDFQAYLQSDELAELRDYQKVASIIIFVSASISIIGSATTNMPHPSNPQRPFINVSLTSLLAA